MRKLTDLQKLCKIVKEIGLVASFSSPEAEAIRARMNQRGAEAANKSTRARAQKQGGWADQGWGK